MAEDVKNYDAASIDLVICGIPVTGGYADGVFVSIKQNSNDFEAYVGADGSVARTRTNDETATVEVTLMSTADANTKFSVLSQLDRLVPGGSGIAPFLVRDKLGTALHAATKCWIAKRPDRDYERALGVRKWVVFVSKLLSFDGGS